MTELEKCLAGLPFEGDDPEIGRMALQTKRLLKELNALDYCNPCRVIKKLK